jgi:hypothetical protein
MEKVLRTLKSRKTTYMNGKSAPLKIIVAGKYIVLKTERAHNPIFTAVNDLNISMVNKKGKKGKKSK